MRISMVPFFGGAVLLLTAFTVLGGQESAGIAAKREKHRPVAHRVSIESESGYGRLLSLCLDSAPFPDGARKDGYSYDGEYFSCDGHYADSSVDVFIPKGFEPRGRVDLVFFFHGWYSSVSEAARDFALIRQFSESGTKALLVMPETARDAPDSYGGKLESADGFDRFVGELLAALHENRLIPRVKVGRITLIGHSGAYHVIARILGQKGAAAKVREVCLFDGLYEDVRHFAAWIASSRGRFVSVCAQDGDPAENARSLEASLREDGIPVVTAADNPGEDRQVLRHRVVFISSPYDHSALVSQADELRRVLAAGVSRR
ncbi:MAG: hypothetical protein ACLQMF_07705 [Rectinemataceae bacterium]